MTSDIVDPEEAFEAELWRQLRTFTRTYPIPARAQALLVARIMELIPKHYQTRRKLRIEASIGGGKIVHYVASDAIQTLCNRAPLANLSPSRVTGNSADVTCGHCVRSLRMMHSNA